MQNEHSGCDCAGRPSDMCEELSVGYFDSHCVIHRLASPRASAGRGVRTGPPALYRSNTRAVYIHSRGRPSSSYGRRLADVGVHTSTRRQIAGCSRLAPHLPRHGIRRRTPRTSATLAGHTESPRVLRTPRRLRRKPRFGYALFVPAIKIEPTHSSAGGAIRMKACSPRSRANGSTRGRASVSRLNRIVSSESIAIPMDPPETLCPRAARTN